MAYNIADLFEHAADAVPDRIAIVVGDLHRSYRDLDERATRFAHHLAQHGVGPGDHVGIHGLNSEPWVVAMLAAFKLRAIPINVNFRYVADELTYLFDNADLVALVHDRAFAERIAEIRARVPKLTHLVAVDDGSGADLAGLPSVDFEEAVAEGSPERDFAGRTGDDLYVLYTGGTTGMPKGVMWRQEDVFYALGGGIDAYSGEPVSSEHALAAKAVASEAPMVTLCCPPLMHGAAQWGTLRFLFEGNTVVFVPKFEPEALWDAVERDRVNTITITGDAMARPLFDAFEANPGRWDVSSLFVFSSSAAVFSPALKQRFLEVFPSLLIVDAIGSTETGHNGMAVVAGGAAGSDGPRQEGLGITVKGLAGSVVLDDDLRPVEPGSGVVGRLARGGNVPVGYYKDEAKTKATFVTAPDGMRYAMPGDWATVEADGSITLLGRGSVSINSGGEKIYPEEVEATLKAHPAVYDALVVGVPDERWGQAVAAIVQPLPGAAEPTLDELAEHCRARIARYKVPRHLTLVEEIQRSPSGKADYPWAKKLLTDRLS